MPATTKYQKTQIMTASPMELILMLYDECIASLERAERAFDEIEGPDRIQHVNNAVLHAEDIITELSISLDLEKGGAVAENLQRLYEFMTYHLSQANVKQQRQPITDVKKMLTDLREAWQKVAAQEPARAGEGVERTATGGISISG